MLPYALLPGLLAALSLSRSSVASFHETSLSPIGGYTLGRGECTPQLSHCWGGRLGGAENHGIRRTTEARKNVTVSGHALCCEGLRLSSFDWTKACEPSLVDCFTFFWYWQEAPFDVAFDMVLMADLLYDPSCQETGKTRPCLPCKVGACRRCTGGIGTMLGWLRFALKQATLVLFG